MVSRVLTRAPSGTTKALLPHDWIFACWLIPRRRQYKRMQGASTGGVNLNPPQQLPHHSTQPAQPSFPLLSIIMVVKIYGHPVSAPCKMVAAICIEKEVPYEFITLDFASKEHKSPEHIARNPWGKIPVIDDDGFILYESRAIARYIAEKYSTKGTQLLPTDVQKRTDILSGFRGEETDAVKLAEHVKAFSESLETFDKILSKQKYIAGDELTIADFYFLPAGTVMLDNGVNAIQEKPNVARWFNELSSRESWKKAQIVEPPKA
ncbi:hypothetical protein NP233_g2723 [Leucocoprinus birnbaumii]|uniref:glutathione transferase n=1 Tax=Leucocoprinus birnbaumii TaxID=56174 RepID=A0AAD5YYI9_9AGAR|nr:hypothetical protein NP233_g2723 [Leucocoprinus birnbaumii]